MRVDLVLELNSRRLLGILGDSRVLCEQRTMSVPLTQVALAAALLAIAVTIVMAARRWYKRWIRRRQWSRAQGAEAEASRLLERLGYDVLGAQVEGSYSLVVDGEPMNVPLRADYMVSRRGRRYIAEVKSGKSAPRLSTAATRRQLLEYLVAFEVDGVLLVDGEERQVHEVVFPVPSGDESPWAGKQLGWIAAGLLTAAIFWLLRTG